MNSFQITDQVTFICDQAKSGIITAVLMRANYTVFGVTWGHDLVERWHTAAELELKRELEPMRLPTIPDPPTTMEFKSLHPIQYESNL